MWWSRTIAISWTRWPCASGTWPSAAWKPTAATTRTIIRQREARLERQRREWEEQQEFIAETEEFIRRNLAGQRTKEAQGRRTRLERFLQDEAIDRPIEHKQIRLGLTTHIRSGDLVLLTKDLVVGYDRPLFRCPDLKSGAASAWP